MGCSRCGRPGVIFQEYSGLHLCQQHFKEDLLNKAKKTVRQNHWLVSGTRYAVALSGGPASFALLDFMHALIGERKDISLIALTIQDNDPEAVEYARKITEASGIPWVIVPEDNTIAIQQLNRSGLTKQSPFLTHASIECQLKPMADELKIDAVALGYTLEDHAEWVIWNAISGNKCQKSGNTAGDRSRVRIIRPFMHILGQELDLYTRLFLNDLNKNAQEKMDNRVDDPVRALLARFYSRHPGVPYALVNIGEQVKKFRDQVS